ncbi:MAG: DUF4142 domain-containing protein [Roseiarcus sp.]
MNRRLLLTSIAAVAATPVLAQTNAAPALSATRDKHIKDTLTIGSLSLMLSRIALPRINNSQLKQFAQFEIAEQETVADVLNAIKTNAAPSGSVATPSDAEVMKNLDETGKAAVEKMRGLRAGVEFDREYHRQEVEGHQKLLEIQEAYLKAPDDLDETNAAKLARGMIKEHLALLADMQKLG